MTPPPPPCAGRAAMGFIFVTVLLDVLALGVIIPVLPKLVSGFMHGDAVGAARLYGLFGTVWALAHFLCSPVVGALSDRWGRRPIILASNAGLGLDYILMALAPSLGWLFAGRVVSGITASSIPAAYAYVADVAAPAERAKAYGWLGAAFGLGFILGPALGGLLGSSNPHLPFWTAAALSLLNALWGLFVLPESLPQERRAPLSLARLNPLGALRLLGSHPDLGPLAFIHFLRNLAHVSLPSIFVLYAGYRYGWGPREVGLCLAGVGVCSMIVQGGLVGPVARRWGEVRMLRAGMLFGATGFFIYGFASTGWLCVAGIPFLSLWGLSAPALQGLMTRRVGPSDQGRLQGANSSLTGLAELIGPGVFTLTFAHFIRPGAVHWPGAPFLLASALLAAAAGVAWTRGAADAR